ncbi:hypothetical protein DC20_10620 [Rufibacter tibetensis]|uniref:Uncharacterized protein n=1 Tax=Rufibacter tibetensis TaxID=512763 RepID=A0A0P0C7G8_9BACT|nr:hypothetical protein DC20_10620 [Rufibacter tibetensis]
MDTSVIYTTSSASNYLKIAQHLKGSWKESQCGNDAGSQCINSTFQEERTKQIRKGLQQFLRETRKRK